MTTADEIAEELKPEDGWSHDPSTTYMIRLAAQNLLDEGVNIVKITYIINGIVRAMQNEYGKLWNGE